MTATALIAEDEGPQRRALVRLLGTEWPELRIIAECTDGTSAMQAIASATPAIAFLDIRMAGHDGLDLAQHVRAPTQVVFTTAYDEYAIRAFELGALDYILKPITGERLRATVQRLQARLREQSTEAGATTPSSSPSRLSWITASVGNNVRVIAMSDVMFFHSRDSTTRVVTRTGAALIRMPLCDLLPRLDPDMFWQVHRSVIVQISAIKAARRNEFGKIELALHDSTEVLPVSQPFYYRFRGM